MAGVPLEFDIPDNTSGESQYCLALHKSGSVLFYNILGELAKAAGKPEFALETSLFQKGVSLVDCPLELMAVLERPGFLFTGFRMLWMLNYIRRFRTSTKLVLVRDPRDMAVSYYFSVASSHTVPVEGSVRDSILAQRKQANRLDVNKFVRKGKCDFIFNNMRQFAVLANNDAKAHVFRYEDVIFEKEKWVTDIARLCQFDVSPEVIAQIAAKHDVRPDEERPDKHIRQVTPGNYKMHLDEATLAHIEKKFENVFRNFNYPLETLS